MRFGDFTNKRPLFFAALAFCLGVFLAQTTGLALAWCIGLSAGLALCIALLFVLKIKKFRGVIILLLIICIAMGQYALYTSCDYDNIPLAGEAAISGNVIQKNVNESGYTYKLGDASINGQTFDKYIFLKCNDDYEIGDSVSAQATLSIPSPPLYKNGFDDKSYCLSQGVFLRAYSWETEKTGEFSNILTFFSDINLRLQNRVDKLFGDQSGMVKALLLGKSQYIEQEVTDAFRKAGVAHVLVVSGLHISILWGCVYFLLRKLRLNRNAVYILTMLIILLYMCITCFQVSVMRASITAILFLTARHFGFNYDSLNMLGLAALVLMIAQPLCALGIGFQMSFIAVFAILCLSPVIAKKLKYQAASMSLAATLGVSAISVNAFNRFSAVGIIANLVIIPLSFAALIVSAAALCLSYIFYGLGELIANLGVFICRLMTQITVFAAQILDIPLPTLGTIFALCVLMIIFLCSPYVKYKLRAKSIIAAVLCVVMTLSIVLNFTPRFTVTFLPGNSAVIEVYGKKATIDTGKNSNAMNNAIKNGGYEFSLITHIDQNHMGGAQSLLEEGYTKRLITTEYDSDYFTSPNIVRAGDIIALTNGAKLKILAPLENPKNPNDSSIVCLLTYNDKNICLFTSDAPLDIQKQILDEVGQVPVLQLSSHASQKQTDEQIISSLNPSYVIASIAKDYSENFDYIDCPMLDTKTSVVFEIAQDGTVTLVN